MEPVWVVSIIVGVIVLLLFWGVSFRPLRFIGLGVMKICIGALFLFLVNTVGGQFDLHVPINLVTATVSGILGIPGVAALIAIDMWVLPS
ncbi:pro-sigmaK processing inhibitor BofA family protein [Bacillus fonticola]|uniref:pro-sigmaK processing inhibitor BofA family protein n=1 Tax=Bacillus fonticola TaxID=2728853 RepID=UPI001475F395|nr:pro-sigmaK processing inhibitor BofA family protein [Bacillus fonticola]